MTKTEIDKVKISKDLLAGVESCSNQLREIKSKLDAFLSDDNQQNAGLLVSKDVNKKRKGISGSEESKLVKIRKPNPVEYSESEQLSTSTVSIESAHSKDKDFKNFGPSKIRGSYVKRFAADIEDKPYKPHKASEKKSDLKQKNGKGRGRPLKKRKSNEDVLKDTSTPSGKLRGRPKKNKGLNESILKEQSPSDNNNDSIIGKDNTIDLAESSSEDVVIDKPINNEKKGRGRPLKTKILKPVSKNDDETIVTETTNNDEETIVTETTNKRGRGRLSTKVDESGDFLDEVKQSSDSEKNSDDINVKKNVTTSIRGRGRPAKVNKLPNGNSKKGRGRPSNSKVLDDKNPLLLENNEDVVTSTPMRRGRPPKNPTKESVTIIEK